MKHKCKKHVQVERSCVFTFRNAILIEVKTKAKLCRCLDAPRGRQVNAYQPSSEETILINIRPI